MVLNPGPELWRKPPKLLSPATGSRSKNFHQPYLRPTSRALFFAQMALPSVC